ncbi:MAG: Gfo/Idh/MocA family oxidoreductase [Planctomycetota bacterium]
MTQSTIPTPPASPEAQPKPVRLAAVGVDSSHLPEFTRRINALHDAGQTPCRVTAFWTDGRHDMPTDQVDQWVADARDLGAEPCDSIDAMLDAADGVLVLSVAGSKHLAHALPSLRRGLPTYIDKPLANTVQDAQAIFEAAARGGARCYSASSLRFVEEIGRLDREALGELVAVDAYGPGEMHDLMPGVLFYGVHTVEMVDAIWGPGVDAVACERTDDRDLMRLRYADGRLATLRLERAGGYRFGATVHGRGGSESFVVDFATVYDRLVAAMTGFFEGKDAPVRLDHTLENVRVMLAANRSMGRGGAWEPVTP